LATCFHQLRQRAAAAVMKRWWLWIGIVKSSLPQNMAVAPSKFVDQVVLSDAF
jgi:hypothetical protein